MKNLYLITLLLFSQWSIAQHDIFDVARSGSVAEVKTLMTTNPNCINQKNKNGHTPLILASYKSNNEVALFLVEHVKDINDQSADGTALMAATVAANSTVVEALINKKANLDSADANGTTALIYATMFRNTEIVELLFYAGANLKLKDSKGKSALDYAIVMKQEKLVSLLKKRNL